ncbi:MAG: carboxypeptidase-like regulatory domain-containing protein, partial [Acidobacteriota bacterium]
MISSDPCKKRPVDLAGRIAAAALWALLTATAAVAVPACAAAPPPDSGAATAEISKALDAFERRLSAVEPGSRDGEAAIFVRRLLRYGEHHRESFDVEQTRRWRRLVERAWGHRSADPEGATGAPPSASGFGEVLPSKMVPLAGADRCQDAPLIDFGSYVGSTAGASLDGAASCAPLGLAPDVWYRVRSPADAFTFVETLGSSFDTVVSVHLGCPGDGPLDAEVACAENLSPPTADAALRFRTVNSPVYIRVSGALVAAGDYVLSVNSGGSIIGRLLGDDGAPISEGSVGTANFIGNAQTEADGRFEVSDVPSARSAVLFGAPGFVTELYDDVPCPDENCDFGRATPVTTRIGEVTQLGDIRLTRAAAVEGRLFDAETSAPVRGRVVLASAASGRLEFTTSDADGRYRIEGLVGGTYYAFTDAGDYAEQAYDGVSCLGFCQPGFGTPFEVTSGETTSGIDFPLRRLGEVRGVVQAVDGTPLPGLQVAARTFEGQAVASTSSAADGTYRLAGLRSGSYLFTAEWDGFQNGPRYVSELYRDVPCDLSAVDECPWTSGTPAEVTVGQIVEGIDFSLSRGGVISGRVALPGGAPVGDVPVKLARSG